MQNLTEQESRKILARYNKARAISSSWRTRLEEVYEYCIPNRNTFTQHAPGEKKDQLVYDSSPLIATNKFISRLQNLLVRPWSKWFVLESGTDIDPKDKDEIETHLAKVSEIIQDAINHSNFSNQISEAFTDLAVSTGVIMVSEDTNPNSDSSIIFKTIPLPQVSLETSSSGDVKTVYREFEIPINQIIPTWPKATLTSNMIEKQEEDPTYAEKLIECTIYREDDFKYDFVLITPEGKCLLKETIDDSPFIVFRENVIPGETFGRGRLMDLISDIKTLNKTVELGLKAAALSISGVFTAVDDGIINVRNIRLEPGAIIPVGSNLSNNPTLAPIQSPANFQIEQMLVQEIRTRINDHLLVQPFGDINDTSVRSATEMNMRQNDFIETSVASFSRLQTELLSKLINKVIFILDKAGKIPKFNIDGSSVKIKYASPVAKMQGIEDLQKFQQFMENVGTIPPETINANVNFDKVPAYIADALALDKDILRTPEEKKQLQEQQAQAQAQQQQEIIMQEQAKQQGQM